MGDTVVTTINQVLINDGTLGAMLSKTTWNKSAVYENWAEKEVKFPYVVVRWESVPGNHWAKRVSMLYVDIIGEGNSSIEVENIKNRIIGLLDMQRFESDESGQIRVYLGGDYNYPEDTPEVIHWNLDFEVIWWRKDFACKL